MIKICSISKELSRVVTPISQSPQNNQAPDRQATSMSNHWILNSIMVSEERSALYEKAWEFSMYML